MHPETNQRLLSRWDRAWLSFLAGESVRDRVRWRVLWVGPILFLAFSGGSLYVASRFGQALGLSFREVLATWLAPDLNSHYTGAHIRMAVYVERSMSFLLLSLWALGSVLSIRVSRAKAVRIIKQLKSASVWD